MTPADRPGRSERLVATGPTDDGAVVLDLGPSHPSAHGVLRLRLELEGDTVVTADPVVGFLHRGAEKLFEVRDYRQGLALANRHDWLSAFTDELVLARAVEGMLGLEVAVRAVWLRTLLAELGRITAGLAFLGAAPAAVGSSPAAGARTAGAAAEAREAFVRLLERGTGGRLHLMVTQVGGLVQDVPAGWLDDVLATTGSARRTWWPELPAGLGDDPAFAARTEGRGVLDPDLALSLGASGPVARASGLPLDLRTVDPDLAYADLADLLAPVVRTAGDAAARYAVLLAEVLRSTDLVDACAERLRGLQGPVNVPLPKVLRVPEGAGYAWLEAPGGIAGVYLQSRGEKVPYRVRLRTPATAHVQALAASLAGAPVDDVVPILTSFFFVVGDIDK